MRADSKITIKKTSIRYMCRNSGSTMQLLLLKLKQSQEKSSWGTNKNLIDKDS